MLGDEEVHDLTVIRVHGGENEDLAAFCPYFRLIDDEQTPFTFPEEFSFQLPTEPLKPAPEET